MRENSAKRQEPYRILLIEDNQGDIFLIRKALDSVGLNFDLESLTDGEEALRHVRRMANDESMMQPDLVMMDLHLPKLDGMDILRAMRAGRLMTTTPVVVLSSSPSRQDRQKVAEYGVARHLVKPADLEEFLSIGGTVREVLDEACGGKED